MKKLFIFLSMLAIGNSVIAQSIPNSGFELWTTVGSYDTPTGWGNLNATTNTLSVYTCEKGTPGQSGLSYLKLTSKSSSLGVIPGVAVSGILDTVTYKPKSGFPFTSRPQLLLGWWQYMAFTFTDQGFISVLLSKWNTITSTRDTVAYTKFALPGMVMLWAPFHIPISYYTSATPDSAMIILSASGATAAPYADNSYLWVDNLLFADSSALATNNFHAPRQNISLFPNPASGIATISYNSNTEKEIQINITAINGANIFSLTHRVVPGKNKIPVNISDLAKGIYIVRITGDNTDVQRLVVN
jgi:hypothetical protein